MDNIQANTIEKVKKPKDPQKVVDFVVSQWKKLQDNRQSQIDLAMNLQKWASMNQKPMKIYNTRQEEIDGYKDNKFATIVEVTTAQIGNQSWTNMGQMFDVRSTETGLIPPKKSDYLTTIEYEQEVNKFLEQLYNDNSQKRLIEEGEKKAELQKKALEQALYRMKADIQLEKCFRYGDLFWGEKISQVGWKQRTLVQKVFGNKENKVDYDNANIQAINPIAFVFDTVKYVKDNDDVFKSIIKIHKRFETIESIINRKFTNKEGKQVNLYNLTSENIQELKNMEDTTSDTTEPQADDQKIQEVKVGDAYATYFAHGDFKIDGQEYKNYIAEIFAEKFLIRFEPNPIYICPFIIQMDEQDPVTKRGIARMKTIYDSCVMRQAYINLKQQKDFLNGNPPTMMTSEMKKELIKPGETSYLWKPGAIIELDDLSPEKVSMLKPFTFDTKGDVDNITFITNEISDNGAVNANAMGNTTSGSVKATDLQLAKQGQDIRTQQTLDSIYKFTIKNIEAVAQILALFKSGVEVFKVKNKNVEEMIAITDIIRQGQYEYRYEDRNALMNRHAKLEQAIQLIEKLSNVPEMAQKFDYEECFKTGMASIEYDNPEKFLKTATTIEGVMAEFQRLQPEEQQQIMMMLLQQAQQGVQGINQGQSVNAVRNPQMQGQVMDNPVQSGLNEGSQELGIV